MTERQFYSAEQLLRITAAHQEICAMRDMDPESVMGRDLAARLLTEYDGEETETDLVRRFAH